MIPIMEREIIPACMPERFSDIEGVVASVKHDVQTIQLDLMDGNYVPEATWPFMFETDFSLQDLQTEDIGFPFWEDVNYELDLMVSKPEEKIDQWMGLGASRVIFHYGSVADWGPIRELDHVIRNFVRLGVAIHIHDTLEDIFPLIDEQVVDFVQVMGIEHIGYMGEPFDDRCIDIVQVLRTRYPNLVISIDGGVSEVTIPLLVEAGANRFVSGSAVFAQGLAVENIEYLRDIANNR